MESIDAIDNGISQYDSEILPKYQISTHLSNRVARLNPNWNEASNSTLEMQRFLDAMKICGEELECYVEQCAFSCLPAQKLVETAVWNRKKVHESGQIIELSSFCPWTDYFFEIEKEMIENATEEKQEVKPILFAIIANKNEFFIRAVPLGPKSFNLRKQLKEAWCGVPDANIETVSGIKGLKFVHHNGFMGGAKTREAALALAVESLSQ